MHSDDLARFGALIADPTRAHLLAILLDGRAYTGGELARHAGVSASTTSEHLSKLRDADLIAVEAQGRHRYFRLSDLSVAELLESVASSVAAHGSPSAAPSRPRPEGGLAYARTCYDHLAGELAVRIFDQLVIGGVLVDHGDHVEVSTQGRTALSDIGVDLNGASPNRPLARSCLDSTERRHHLAGAAGQALLTMMLKRRWLVRGPRPRTVRVTRTGHAEIPAAFGLPQAAF